VFAVRAAGSEGREVVEIDLRDLPFVVGRPDLHVVAAAILDPHADRLPSLGLRACATSRTARPGWSRTRVALSLRKMM
jgi:hypothetical protein